VKALEELVSVVVPVYNAAATLGATLVSVRNQTWRNLEIIVVDDGSTDTSFAIATAHQDQDARVRIIRQANGGVAAARNRGIDAAKGRFVAPLDADDMWLPSKIERQMEVMTAAGPDVGLVYTGYAMIDEAGRVQGLPVAGHAQGNVLRQLCRENFIGNGSSVLFRREVLQEIGGYDVGLRAVGAQGCEDLQLYLAIAERFQFAVVPECLTGYRLTSTTMTCDVLQMLKSVTIVLSRTVQRHPEFREEAQIHLNRATSWFMVRALSTGRIAAAAALFRQARQDRIALELPSIVDLSKRVIMGLMPRVIRARLARARARPVFLPSADDPKSSNAPFRVGPRQSPFLMR